MNKNFYSFFKSLLLVFFVLTGHMSFAQTTLYDESVSGDLPNSTAGPVLTVSAAGTYVVKGTLMTAADGQDRFQLSISSGYQITGISYSISGGSFINGQINVGGYASASGGGGSVSLSPYSSLPAGTYATMVGVDFSTGSTWSATFTVTTAPTPPSVSTQPSDKTACSGSTATFTSTATGSPAPTVQWQESPDGGSTWNDIAGATSTTLTITATTAKNGYQYGATFTNSGGTDYSNAATLTVISSPTVTTNPSNQTVTAGSSATFTAAASGSPTVQWQVSTDGGSTYNNISGATSNTLTFTTSSSQSGNKYRATYTNSCGSINTNSATLTVNGTPIVTTNPSNNTFCSGSTATFTAAATGSPTPTVQWQISTDGGVSYNNISGATSTTLTFTAASSQNNNKYRAVFTNTNGSATTNAATITVNVAPTVSTNPTGQTVCSGNSASFTASAGGTPTPTVQWQLSTDGGTTFNNISGATSATLSFTTAASQNNNQYRAVFTNSCGNVTTSAATLNVNVAPSVTTNPSSASFCPGASTSFTAAASGTPTPTVQWQLSTDGGTTYNNISGATSNIYTFTNAGSENGYKYRAVYTNSCGTVNTSAATLNMNAVPVVTTNPSTQTICSGSNVSFLAAASGTPTPTVQWQLSTDGGTTFNNISGATGTTLSFATTTSQNGNQYRAVFANTCNTATTTAATLNIDIAPSITTNPSDITVCPGTTTTFTAAASGIPTPTVQWQLSTDGGTTYNNISGATSNTYTFTNTGSENGYKYRAVYTNSCGNITSTSATLTLNTVPAVTTNPATQTICAGTTVTFNVAASGTPTPTVQWQMSTDGGTTFNNISGATALSLSFATLASQSGNQYRAIFTNLCNVATTTAATLNVTTSPVVNTNPVNLTSCAGTTASFTTAATATPTPTVQWQVSTDGGATFNNISGATATTLAFTSAAVQNNNQYRAVFTNSCGTATTTAAVLTVNVASAITTNPSDLTLCEGTTASFIAAASGTPTPTVQWQLSTDGGSTYNNMVGETGTTLLFAANAAQTGNKYRAVFTNSCGTATTTAATVSVNTKPVVTANPTATTICAGSSASFTAASTGIPTPGVQWQVSTDGGGTFNNIPGATTATLTFATLVSQNGNQYRAVFTNTCGSATTAAVTMTVNSLPAITVNPSNTTVCEGTSTYFTSAATGTGINYQWQVNTGSGFANVPALAYYSGINSPILSISGTSASLNGYQYRCVVTGTCSPAATSSAATLTVNRLPAITVNPNNDTICAGSNASFTVTATGTALTYQWQVDDGTGAINVTNGSIYSGANTATLTLTNVPVSMSTYTYKCIVSGVCSPSVTSTAAVLKVNSLPAITSSPSNVTLCEGATA
ncbi:MAG: beta strand repeat-containing protein, partial [Flavipsychrobacter sp.]